MSFSKLQSDIGYSPMRSNSQCHDLRKVYPHLCYTPNRLIQVTIRVPHNRLHSPKPHNTNTAQYSNTHTCAPNQTKAPSSMINKSILNFSSQNERAKLMLENTAEYEFENVTFTPLSNILCSKL